MTREELSALIREHEHGVHRPVADVRQYVQAFEVSQTLDNPGEALGEDLHIVDVYQVILLMVAKFGELIPHEILAKAFLLIPDPLDGQPDR